MLDRGRLAHFAPGDGETEGAHTAAFADAGWLDVAIPGDVHATLIAAGQIPDPFVDRNETACAWMEEREWWYRVRFDGPAATGPGERLRLVCHGLDTFATVWLNGKELGRHENMFRQAVFDVSERLRPGVENLLALRFDPPLARIEGRMVSAWGANPERVAMRKAQFGYGWDWGPRLPTIGVWRPIALRRERSAALVGVHAATVELTGDHGRALVAVRVQAERFAGDGALVARIAVTPPDGGPAIAHDLALGGAGQLDATAFLTLDRPRLWWTHDLGDPALHEVRVTLREGGEERDRWDGALGVRTLELDQSPDHEERGTRFFRFVLNGVPVFARGADWIPCDSFVGAIPPERYDTLVDLARHANMTMLRVWGGGIYEHDAFYDACDRLGLLVWQDFMFACAMYPEDDAYAAEVEAEARYQVRRLRNHPCLALWCGNNENQWLHDGRYWNDPNPPPYGERYYHNILPRVVAAEDGRTPYWPGSPFGGNDHNSMDQGNRHNWDVWHGQFPRRFGEQPRQEFTPENVSYLRYAEDSGRFVSEFGMHAAPVRETLRRVIPADQLFHHSPSLDWHNKDNPKNKGDLLMQATVGLPTDLDDYIAKSQFAQAEGLKFSIEHYRRRKPHCSGALVWQFNDCWPVLSWSVLDHNGFGKAGFWALTRVFSPVLASFKPLADGGVELWLTNETLAPVADDATVRLATFGGETIRDETCAVAVPANSSRAVAAWSAAELGGGPDRYLAVRSAGGLFPANRHLFAPIKDLVRTAAAPEMTATAIGDHELRVELTGQAGAYAMLVRLFVPHEATRYADNAFDLAPGEHREIAITNPDVVLAPGMVGLDWL